MTAEASEAPPRNASFSTKLPTLQLIIDSTSLGEFKTCPRRYYYRIIEGWVPRAPSVHLTFGLLLHHGREEYELLKAQGWDHEAALSQTIYKALLHTWDNRLNKPWWSGHPAKNRLTLIRTLVWYLDQFGLNDPLQTVILANEQPAIELSFQFDSGLLSVTNEPIMFAGHLDRLVAFGEETYVSDLKTTSSTLSSSYFAQYSPDNQFSLYALAGRIAFRTPISGVIVDAAQVAATFSRFERQIIPRTTEQLNEWLEDTNHWLGQMARSAVYNHWPMNDKNCHHYGGCPFRPVCSRVPSARQQWLELDYIRSTWDPSIPRGNS